MAVAERACHSVAPRYDGYQPGMGCIGYTSCGCSKASKVVVVGGVWGPTEAGAAGLARPGLFAAAAGRQRRLGPASRRCATACDGDVGSIVVNTMVVLVVLESSRLRVLGGWPTPQSKHQVLCR